MSAARRLAQGAPLGPGAWLALVSLFAAGCGADPAPPPPCPRAPGHICTYLGNGTPALGIEGAHRLEDTLYLPQDVTFGPDRRPYVLDWNNHRIRVVAADDTVWTVAGTGELGDGPEGPALESRFNHPTHIAFDAPGRMVIAAWHNSKIKRVDLSTGELSDICGNGERAFAGDGGPAEKAILDLPAAVAFDVEGGMYIMDQANQRVRRVRPDGIIETVLGNGVPGYSGDGGPAKQAQISQPVGQAAAPAGRIEMSPAGDLFLADTGNHVVRRMFRVEAGGTPTWHIETVAGSGVRGAGGDGGPAPEGELHAPTDVALAPEGTLYIADTQNSCVRAVEPDGTLRTAAGICGEPGDAGDGGPATGARLDRPYGIAVDPEGNLVIADTHNHKLRVVYR